jgi:hypothetical protein
MFWIIVAPELTDASMGDRCDDVDPSKPHCQVQPFSNLLFQVEPDYPWSQFRIGGNTQQPVVHCSS